MIYQRHNTEGSALIFLVMCIVLFALMGIAMLSLSSTAAITQVAALLSSQAYYLAESGFRFVKTSESWDDLHGKTFTFSNDMEQFTIALYPYYFMTSVDHSTGEVSLQVKDLPLDFNVPVLGQLRVGSDSYAYSNYSEDVFTGLSPSLQSDISEGTDVYLVTNPLLDQTLENNGDLEIADGSFFPKLNGPFSINDTLYAYAKRVGDTLHDVFLADKPDSTFSVDVFTTDNVILTNFIKLKSTGIINPGFENESKRKITYYMPIVAGASLITNGITAEGSQDPLWPEDPMNTLDGDTMTYWSGTDGLSMGETNYLSYQFSKAYNFYRMDFHSLPWQPPYYFMGELDIQLSDDGVNWTTFHHIDGDFIPGDTSFSIFCNTEYTSWIRLFMEYQGRGAHGGSPAFYLNEIAFHGNLPGYSLKTIQE